MDMEELVKVDTVMDKQRISALIGSHRECFNDFAVKSLFLFGSVARNQATTNSDVDMLVEFFQPAGLFTLLKLQHFLEELLECSVDLGTLKSLRPHLRDSVLQEAIRVL